MSFDNDQYIVILKLTEVFRMSLGHSICIATVGTTRRTLLIRQGIFGMMGKDGSHLCRIMKMRKLIRKLLMVD